MTDNSSLVEDLRVAVGDVSLTQAMLMTFPCVLLVAGGMRVLSLVLRGPKRFEDDGLVGAACYAVGWQAGSVACIATVFVLLQVVGMNPVDTLFEVVNRYGNFVALLVMVWGGLILAPSLRGRLPVRRRWPMPVALTASVVVAGAALLGSMGTLMATADFGVAARARLDREADALFGDLQVDVLSAVPVDGESMEEAERFVLTVAYSSRAKGLLVVPPQEELSPPEEVLEKVGACRLRVIGSSLDGLPDGAMIVEPGATRVARYTVELDVPGDEPHERRDMVYRLAYHLREADGFFTEGEALFRAPGAVLR